MLGLELSSVFTVASMMVRGLRKPMDAVKASMGDLTPSPYLIPCLWAA